MLLPHLSVGCGDGEPLAELYRAARRRVVDTKFPKVCTHPIDGVRLLGEVPFDDEEGVRADFRVSGAEDARRRAAQVAVDPGGLGDEVRRLVHVAVASQLQPVAYMHLAVRYRRETRLKPILYPSHHSPDYL